MVISCAGGRGLLCRAFPGLETRVHAREVAARGRSVQVAAKGGVVYRYETAIRLRHTDAAGVVYFARVLDLAHEAMEAFLQDVGCPLPAALHAARPGYPVVQATARYLRPLRMGDLAVVLLRLTRLGPRSLTFASTIQRDGEIVAEVELVHVAADLSAGAPTQIPEDLATRLRPHVERMPPHGSTSKQGEIG